MATLLRLLLALCLVASALPGAAPPAADSPPASAASGHDADLPPCHAPDPAPAATDDGATGAHGCCAGGGDCGCGCAQVAGLPVPAPRALAMPAPAGPPARAVPIAASPRLPRPVRPPIA